MSRSIKQYTNDELQALKARLDAHFAVKGDNVTQKERKLMQVVNAELLTRPEHAYPQEVVPATPRFSKIGQAPITSVEDESINVNPTHRGEYTSLEDCYEPGSTEVWYFRKGMANIILTALEEHNKEQLPQLDDLSKTHIKVGTVNSNDQREVFAAMQGDQWSPHGEAKQFIHALGLGHISMSPGDIIIFPQRTVMVSKRGFYDLGQRTDVEENLDFGGIIDGARELADGPAPMAFSVGDTVYYGSRTGKLVSFAGTDRDKLLVDLPNGSRDIFPVQGVTLKKPNMIRRAVQWSIGEDSLAAGTTGPNDTRSPVGMAVGSNVHYKPGQMLYQGSQSGEFVRFADGLRKKMILVKTTDGNHAMFASDKASTTKPSLLCRAKMLMTGESVNENFAVGTTVYCGSRSGVVQGFAQDDRTKLLVKRSNGETDTFPVDQTSKEKPSAIRKAAQWVMGEGYQAGQTVYCNGKSGKVVDYARGDATKSNLIVKMANGQTESHPVSDVSTTPPPRKMSEDFGSSDMGGAMRRMISFIKTNCDGNFVTTPEVIEMAAQDAASWYADMLGVDEHEAAEIFTHHFMMRLRSGQMLVDEDTVVASAGTAGQVNVQGGVIGEEEVEEADLTLGVPKGEIYKPKMQCLHYFNTKGTQEWELEKMGMKKDKFGRYYLPQYDRGGINYDSNFNSLANVFGNPRTINLKK
jgi:hypothetical protein